MLNPSAIEQVVAQNESDDVVVGEGTILFIEDTTSWEALDIHKHTSGAEIGK